MPGQKCMRTHIKNNFQCSKQFVVVISICCIWYGAGLYDAHDIIRYHSMHGFIAHITVEIENIF